MNNKMFLLILDAYSKWPEIYIQSNATSSRTITTLREVFARLGLPKQIVTDNGPQFVSEEYETFLKANGIRHIQTAPYHPAMNRAVERLVQTPKQALRAGAQSGVGMEQMLSSFLLRYRNTPHATTGVSPSSLLFGQNLRTRLDLLWPDIGARVRDQQERQKSYHDRRSKAREVSVGETVWIQNYRDSPRWVKGVVVDRVGPVSYLVQTSNGDIWRRHIEQLRPGGDDNDVSCPDDDDVSLPLPPQNMETPPVQDPQEQPSQPTPTDPSPSSTTAPAESNASRYPTWTRTQPNRLYSRLNHPDGQ